MLETNEKKEIYLASIGTGHRLLFVTSVEPEEGVSIAEKKNRVIKELKEKLGTDSVTKVKFYGYATITKSNNFVKKSTRKKLGI